MIRRAGVVMLILGLCCVPVTLAADEDDDLEHFFFRGYFSWFTASSDTRVGPTFPIIGATGDLTNEVFCDIAEGCATLTIGEGSGWAANFEFRAIHLFGIEIGGTTHDVDGQLFLNTAMQNPSSAFTCRTTVPGDPSTLAYDSRGCIVTALGDNFDGEIKTDMVYVGANFHLWKKGSPLDLYIGPFYGDVEYDDGTIGMATAVNIDGENVWGLNGAFEYSIGDRWLVGAGLRYVRSEPDVVLTDIATNTAVATGTLRINPFIFSVGGGIKF